MTIPRFEFNPTLLSKQNYHVESAEDGKTALAVFEQFNPDLVILDVNLPDVIGYNLCQEMQNRTRVFCSNAD